MNPTTTAFTRREDLGLRYDEFDLAMNRIGFIGHRVMPIIMRDQTSGKFPRITIGQFMQNLDTSRNVDGTYKRSSGEFSDDTYDTKEYGLEAQLDDRTVKRYGDIIDAEVFEGERIENALLTGYERAVAALMFSAITFSGKTGAVGTPWSTIATATPVTDINAKIDTIRIACGAKPNALICNDKVFRDLIRCSQVLDNMKTQNFQDVRVGAMSRAALAMALNIDEVIVAGQESGGLYNTKEPGITPVMADIWGNGSALLCRVAMSNNPAERCVGRTFVWNEEGATDGDRMAVVAESYYEDARRGGVLRRRFDYGLETMQLECGWLFTSV